MLHTHAHSFKINSSMGDVLVTVEPRSKATPSTVKYSQHYHESQKSGQFCSQLTPHW